MDSEMRSPLTVQGLCKNYPAFRLENVSFSLTPGTIIGFIGRNGAGKTTTINSILSFIHPDAGKISFFGLEYPEHDREIKKGIGFVSAGMTYYTRKKLKEITGVTKTFYPDWDDGAYRKWLDSFGLDEEKTPAELSNGIVSREELVEVFLKLKDEGKTVFFSTHITSDLEKCADRILFLQKGVLKADDTLENYQAAWRIVECGNEIPPDLKQAACGSCRIKDGYTVLVRREDAAAFESREASLEEIMVHLEKEAEEA